jgi:hypothetical protein
MYISIYIYIYIDISIYIYIYINMMLRTHVVGCGIGEVIPGAASYGDDFSH